MRQKEIYDGAIPSGNSVALLNLVRLYRFTGSTDFEDKASQIIKTFSQTIKTSPLAYTYFLSALDFYFGPSKEFLLMGSDQQKIKSFMRVINECFIPNKITMYKNEQSNAALTEIAEYTKSYQTTDDKTVVYLCEDFSCKLPISSKAELSKQIQCD